MKIKILLSFTLTLLITTAFLIGGQAAEPENIKCPGKVNVLVAPIIPTTFTNYYRFSDSLIPAKTQTLVSTFAGVVQKVQVKAGTPVQAGDTILSLDASAVQNEISQLNQEIKKLKKLVAKKTKVAKKEAEAKLSQAIELLAQKEAQAKNCLFTAAFNGVVDTVKVTEGDHISDGFLMATVIDTTRMVVIIPEANAAKVTEGQTLSVTFPALSQTIIGTVQKSEQSYVVLNNEDNKLTPNMKANVKIPAQPLVDVVVLPQAQILKDDSGSYVYTVNQNLARKTSLKTGPEEKGMVLVIEGLSAGDEIITHEIQDAKKGLVKDRISCLTEGKKIVVMEKNEAKGLYTARKISVKPSSQAKSTPIKSEPKPEIKPEKKKKNVYQEAPLKAAKLRVGATFHYFKMNSVFEDVYGRIMGYGLDLSYGLSKKLDLWLVANYGSKTATLEDFPAAPMKFKFIPVSLDLRYFFKRGHKLDIFAGAGFTYYAFKDVSPLSEIQSSAIGINLVGGGYFHLSNKLSLQAALRWSTAKKDIEAEPVPDAKLDLSGLDLILGISYKIK